MLPETTVSEPPLSGHTGQQGEAIGSCKAATGRRCGPTLEGRNEPRVQRGQRRIRPPRGREFQQLTPGWGAALPRRGRARRDPRAVSPCGAQGRARQVTMRQRLWRSSSWGRKGHSTPVSGDTLPSSPCKLPGALTRERSLGVSVDKRGEAAQARGPAARAPHRSGPSAPCGWLVRMDVR